MTLKQYQASLSDIKQKVLAASQLKFDLKKVVTDGSYMYDFNYNKAKYMADRVKRSAAELVMLIEKVHKQNKNPRLDDALSKIMVNTKFIVENYLEPKKALPIIEQIERQIADAEKLAELEKEIKDFEKEAAATPSPRAAAEIKLNFALPELPEEIQENIAADVAELEKCYAAGLYRSAIILCGRVIETALHRKYFDVTGNDALEKEPGIGLGKLVARMSEKSVRLDPGLPQQIHFINQVRIFSVHTKQEAFNPSKSQAQATILYTMDVLGKLFS
ncbi:hypothetical protein KY363_03630 [Candidatus Woesearchaeota archaeon]|nr:hypothetical protein [Candidatus Woesearchaeota archaeon]